MFNPYFERNSKMLLPTCLDNGILALSPTTDNSAMLRNVFSRNFTFSMSKRKSVTGQLCFVSKKIISIL